MVNQRIATLLATLVTWLIVVGSSASLAQEPDPRRAEMERLLRIFPRSEEWEAWLQKSGELPPDFDKMPSIPWLPDPLVIDVGSLRGRRAKSLQDPRRRAETPALDAG